MPRWLRLTLALIGASALMALPLTAQADGAAIDEARIVAVVETSPWLDVCRAALDAHRSQVDPADPFWQFYRIVQELPGAGEAYQLGFGIPFPDTGSRADDVFAGLGV